MTSGRVRSALITAISVAAVSVAAAPAHAAAESPPTPSGGSSAIGPQEIFDWLIAFALSALGIA